MKLEDQARPDVSAELVEAIRSFPVRRTVQHCGASVSVSPFDLYADCPRCGARIKVRGFSGAAEVADLFDAVFEWMLQPGASELVSRRQQVILSDGDD